MAIMTEMAGSHVDRKQRIMLVAMAIIVPLATTSTIPSDASTWTSVNASEVSNGTLNVTQMTTSLPASNQTEIDTTEMEQTTTVKLTDVTSTTMAGTVESETELTTKSVPKTSTESEFYDYEKDDEMGEDDDEEDDQEDDDQKNDFEEDDREDEDQNEKEEYSDRGLYESEHRLIHQPMTNHLGHGRVYMPSPVHGLYWEEKHYMLSVLIPIACGILGAVLIVCVAYGLRNCNTDNSYSRQMSQLTAIRRRAIRSQRRRPRVDHTLLLGNSSDEESRR